MNYIYRSSKDDPYDNVVGIGKVDSVIMSKTRYLKSKLYDVLHYPFREYRVSCLDELSYGSEIELIFCTVYIVDMADDYHFLISRP